MLPAATGPGAFLLRQLAPLVVVLLVLGSTAAAAATVDASLLLPSPTLLLLEARAERYDPTNRTLQYDYPQDDVSNPLRYIPTLSIAIVATVLYFLLFLALLGQLIRYGQRWMLTLVIGTICYSFGMAVRLWFRVNTHSSGVYIVFYLFTVLSPCAMLAADYVLLGRLVRHLGMDRYLRIPARRTTKIFVLSDVTTFLIQAAGGGLATSREPKTNDTGSKIFLAGIALQLVSFALFTFLMLDFGWKIRKHERHLWTGALNPADKRWKHLYFAALWSCVFFLVRSFFRVVELSQGFHGHLATHEVYIYTLDTLPLFLGCLAFALFYPGRFLRPHTAGAHPWAYDDAGVLRAEAKEPVVVVGGGEGGEEAASDGLGEKRRRRRWGWKRRGGQKADEVEGL